ncbi:MAG: hypothetical protein ACRDYU_19095 [Actinomycetes bacterium]
MSTGTTPARASRALFAALVDDAALFPPGSAPMPDALAAHREHRRAAYADLVGPFLCPASRVPEMQSHLVSGDALPLRLIADGGPEGLAGARDLLLDDDRVELVGVELPIPASPDMGAAARLLLDVLDFSVDAYVEIPRGAGWEAALDVLAADGAEHAKFRTGGTNPEAYPSETELAVFIRRCLDTQVSFKLTAGLHHAVRRTEPVEGFEEHGFANVLAATRAGLIGAEAEDMAAILAERDRTAVVGLLERMSDADAAVVRAFFLSYGSCSVTEPLDDLLALGLLSKEDA